MRRTIAALAMAALPWLGPEARAQLPASTRYVASAFGTWMTAGNSLVGFDAAGAITTVVGLVAPNIQPSAVGMAPTNDAVLVWDAGGVHRYDIATGAVVFTSLNTGGGTLHWGCLDEDGGMIWSIGMGVSQGDIYKSIDTVGSLTTLVARLPLQNLNAVCWIGATGQYAAAQYATPGGAVYVIARDGTILKAIPNLVELSGLDWNPWDEKVYASNFGQGSSTGLYQLDVSTGQSATLGPIGAITEMNNAVEALHQPANLLVCAEFGNNPQHLWTLDPVTRAVTTLYATSQQVGFSDVAIVRGRPLWATAVWSIGGRGDLSVNFGPTRAGDAYQVALSLGTRPAIPVPPIGRIHLAPDNLFVASVKIGAPLFNRFAGVLDLQGRASPPPFVLLPAIAALRGVRVFGAAVAYNASGIRAISNVWGTTIQ